MNSIVALFVRSLRQDSKHLPAHLLRGGLVAMLVVIIYSMMRETVRFNAPGLRVYTTIMWVNYMFISVAAIGYFATSITEEKEEETLGLLRMAGISPLALLLGKAISRLWLAIVLICVQFPFALLAITLGGVTLRQVAASYVALGAYTFFLSGVATLCSVVARTSMRSVVYMIVAFAFMFMLPTICDGINTLFVAYAGPTAIERADVATSWVLRLSVLTRLLAVMKTGYDGPILAGHFYVNVVAAAGFFFMSWLVFDFFANRHTDNSLGTVGRSLKRKLRLTPGRTWRTALPWKDFHFGAGGYWGWIVRLFLLALATTALSFPEWYYFGQLDAEDVTTIAVSLSLLFAFIETTIHSIRLLSDEHAARTLPLLAMMPWSVTRTIYAKLVGFAIGMLPYVLTLTACFIINPKIVDDFLTEIFRRPEQFFAFCYFMVLVGIFFHLSAFLATYIKWGAAPVAFGILLAFNMCCLFTMSSATNGNAAGGMFFILSCVGMVVMAALQYFIGERFLDLQGR